MTVAVFQFNETSPNAASTTVLSVNTVKGSLGVPGVASDVSLYQSITVSAILVGATGGTLDVWLQNSHDDGTTWFDYAHWPQVAAGAAELDVVWSASQGAQQTTMTTVGKNLFPLLAANVVIGGPWGGRFRLIMKSGVGTTAGSVVIITIAAQMQPSAYRS